MAERFNVEHQGVSLAGEVWSGYGPPLVLLHAGVADGRSWAEVAPLLTGASSVCAYDRRGHGETPRSTGLFRHLDDLLEVLDRFASEPAWLVGSSAGGGLALDAALVAPERLAGLVLLAPAVSGAPAVDDAVPQPMIDAYAEAASRGDHETMNRLEVRFWLDGPDKEEGRVAGPRRELMLAMNAIVLENETAEPQGESGVDAWARLEEIDLPTTVACGDLDVGYLLDRSQAVAERLPCGRYVPLPGRAHLPYLEDPSETAELILGALMNPWGRPA